MAVLCRSKNFYDDNAVSQLEQKTFTELQSPVKEYNAAVNQYKLLYKKLVSNKSLKKQGSTSTPYAKLIAATRRYLYLRYLTFPQISAHIRKNTRRARKTIRVLTKLNRRSLRTRRKTGQLAAVLPVVLSEGL